MSWIHEQAGWPALTWDDGALAGVLARVRFKQGQLLGTMAALGFELRREASVVALTEEGIKSSAIEGERLNREEVRSSVARRLGLDVAGLPRPGREVEGIVEMMIDATRRFDSPLTSERLFDWHAALFPTGRSGMHRITVGAWRGGEGGPMQVVSGPLGRERVHFETPGASRLEAEMERFLGWFEAPSSVDPVLRAGVAHFWFVTIHPFDDGNGRIARAVTDLALARAEGSGERFYSMSAAIEATRKDYYLQLEFAQRGGLDITQWLLWFLACFERAVEDADRTVRAVLYKASLWQRISHGTVNERQRLVINRLLDGFEGPLTTSRYSKLARCSTDTALRDIGGLVERGLLVRNEGGGRSTSYRLVAPGEVVG